MCSNTGPFLFEYEKSLRSADLIRLGVEQKLKRRCSLQHTKSERFVAAISKPGTGTPIFGPRWFNDRAWPKAPLYPGHDGRSRSRVTLRLFLWLT